MHEFSICVWISDKIDKNRLKLEINVGFYSMAVHLFQIEREFSIRVWASDGITKAEREVNIIVVDANDTPPQFTQQTYKTTIPEVSFL